MGPLLHKTSIALSVAVASGVAARTQNPLEKLDRGKFCVKVEDAAD